jgi:hypothetical protein
MLSELNGFEQWDVKMVFGDVIQFSIALTLAPKPSTQPTSSNY